MKVINLTPHDVNFCDENGNVIKRYWANGRVARVANGWETIGHVNGIPIVERTDMRIVNLPEPREDTMYIVSNIVLNFCKDRTDLLAPVLQVEINERVVGCRAFVSNR